ncbi:ferredoxin [Proteiniclasticum sp. QWL-01]|uniref:ferredoxin n=1 Tax=Proteiniclasticum sp. QWL-01 TaxID=3036945 RepID=UPI002206ACAC|nr:ferredoxin [Proteiniclasticum sp. QWL-01]UUM10646.1 ferredoxin [Clostridiaceae bacterium HFYG-1003]WFF71981.1 ferredoxin [Proteiniclasticum sp. QWL-01]
MNPVVDKDLCIGCGLCPSIAPEIFEMEDDGKAVALVAETSDPAAQEAADSCPVGAILL